MEGLEGGEASPDEFPWICTMFAEDRKTKKQRFLGACVIVPPSTDNSFPEGNNTSLYPILLLGMANKLLFYVF